MFDWRKKRKQQKRLREAISQVRYILHADDDVLSDAQKETLAGVFEAGEKIREQDKTSAIDAYYAEAKEKIRRYAPKYRSSRMREILDILAVVCMIAFGLRGLFAQPFKIPTSSMQPTLFGTHYLEKDVVKTPYPMSFLLSSAVPAQATIQSDGRLDQYSISETARFGGATLPGKFFFGNSSFMIGNSGYTLPGTWPKVYDYTQLNPNREYRKGETLADGWMSLGDHLFVDQLSHHFFDFKRGEVVVFNTRGILENGKPLAGYYYIKRLAGMPGDTLRIDRNQLYVKPKGASEFKRVQDLAPAFEKLYSGMGGYQGHLNIVGTGPCRYLGSPSAEFVVPEDCYFMLGDNSLFSSDSRIWGVVPRRNMVGRAAFVFWPFTRRWGIPDHEQPIQVPTSLPEGNSFPQMALQ
jgi:signal peptidase I